jgi:hypothetical protein
MVARRARRGMENRTNGSGTLDRRDFNGDEDQGWACGIGGGE